LEDNPGAIEAIINWTKDNYQEELEEINDEDEDEDDDNDNDNDNDE
jgi:hypothetical protein